MRFARKRGALDVWVRMLDTKITLDISGNENVYTPLAGGQYLLSYSKRVFERDF